MRISELLITALMLPVAAGAASTIKLATLAPEGSNWTKVLRAIDADVREQTDDHVGFKIYTGGVQGDEKTMLRKTTVPRPSTLSGPSATRLQSIGSKSFAKVKASLREPC